MAEQPVRPDLDAMQRTIDLGWESFWRTYPREVGNLLRYTRDLERLAQAVCDNSDDAPPYDDLLYVNRADINALQAVMAKREEG